MIQFNINHLFAQSEVLTSIFIEQLLFYSTLHS